MTTPKVWFPAIRSGSGADVFTERLCQALQAQGIRAEITWLPHRAEYAPWTVPVPELPDWATVCHINSWLPRRFVPQGVPTVVTVHHLVHDPAFSPFRSFAQAGYHNLVIRRRELCNIRRASAITTVSEYVRRTVQEFSGRKDVVVVPNWVGTQFAPGFESDAARNIPFHLFIAGNQSRRKGIDLLPALAKALGDKFLIRYAGSSRPLPHKLPRVVELGRISASDLLLEYQQCDAVVSLSRYEGFGYTALEAAACGKPFIGFRHSGLAEVCGHDSPYLAEDGNVEQLAEICMNLEAEDSCLQAARQYYYRRSQLFSEAASCESYLKIYMNVMTWRP